MKNVVFKLKFNHPNNFQTPKLNENHFSYICKRARAMYNEGKDFCCFGKVSELGYNNFGNIDDFQKMKNHIKEKSKDKTVFYKCVISLIEEDAIEKGFDTRIRWEQLMKNNYSKLAKQLGIKIENFEYVCSVHMEKGHPHIHFIAWDKKQEILKTNIPKTNFANIRKILTNDIFKEDLQQLYDTKNKSKDEYKNYLEQILNISDDEYSKILKELQSLDIDLNKSKLFNIKLEEKYINEIFKEIYLLRKSLPKTGRLSYAFMSDEIKQQLNLISKKIIDNNLELNTSFIKYIKSIKSITEFATKDEKYIEKNVKNAEDEILKFTSNQILKICKEMNNREFIFKREILEENRKQFENEQILNLVYNLMNFITKSDNKNKNRNIIKNKTESLVAKKELAKKLENKSQIDWENER